MKCKTKKWREILKTSKVTVGHVQPSEPERHVMSQQRKLEDNKPMLSKL